MWCLFEKAAVLALYATCVKAVSEVELPITARTEDVDSGWTTVIYDAENPGLVGNDGGSASGGFRIFSLNGENPLPEAKHETPGRTKLVTTVYDVQGKDIIVTIAQTDSLFRLYDASSFEQIGEPLGKTLGDWSALCAWKSQTSGEQYLYLFGKHQAVQFLLRNQEGSLDIAEIQTFETPVEAASCGVSLSAEMVFFSEKGDPTVYTFKAAESTTVPSISTLGEAGDGVTGLAVYFGNSSDYLVVAQTDVAALYDTSFNLQGSWKLTGDEDIEVKGLSFYQVATSAYPTGLLAYAVESAAGKGFGVSSLDNAFSALALEANTAFDPRKKPSEPDVTVCSDCGNSGFCGTHNSTRTCSVSRISFIKPLCLLCMWPTALKVVYKAFTSHNCCKPQLPTKYTQLTRNIAVLRRLQW